MVRHNSLKVSEHHLISSLIKLFDCHLNRLIEGSELKGQSETALNPLFEGVFFFSCIWSIGAVCDSQTKKMFDTVFTELTEGCLSEEVAASLGLKDSEVPPPLETPYVFPLPADKDVFSYKLLIGKCSNKPNTVASWVMDWDTVFGLGLGRA